MSISVRVLDLFSGIGGFSLGLERAGMQTIAFCERDEFCRAVLAKHWPVLPCFEDIHDLDADRLGRLGRIDLVCGGFPCQPFSQAGKQRAQDDDRHLWPAMREVIALSRPTWVIGENVAGLIALALDDVLFDLESLGYATRTFVVPACAVDARHRRDRVWIIARDANREGKPDGAEHDEVAKLCSPIADSHSARLEGRHGSELPERTSEWTSRQSSAFATNASSQRWNAGSIEEPGKYQGNRSGKIGGRCSTDGAVSVGWKPEPNVGRVANGVPRRVDRLRTLGNAVVPQVVYELGRAIMNQHTSRGSL